MDAVAIEKTKSAFLLKIGERWVNLGVQIREKIVVLFLEVYLMMLSCQSPEKFGDDMYCYRG